MSTADRSTVSQAEPVVRRFSPAQLRALQAMGLVAWVRRTANAQPCLGNTPPGASGAPATSAAPANPAVPMAPTAPMAPAPAPAISAAPAAPVTRKTPLPAERLFPGWQLQPFEQGSRRVTTTGPADAGLLILVEPVVASGAVALPLSHDDGKLLRAMLQSIDCRLSDACLAGLARDSGQTGSAPSDTGPSIGSLQLESLRAVLVLTPRSAETAQTRPVDFPSGARSVPLWYCPHPALLRAVPQHKRAAWQILKAVRQRLGPR